MTQQTQQIAGVVYYQGMALSQIIEASRLTGETRVFFENYAATEEEADALQNHVFCDAFKRSLDSGLYQELSPQAVVKNTCNALIRLDGGAIDCTTPAEWRLYRNIAKRFIRAWVADAWMEYHPAEETKGDAEGIPAYYSVNPAMLKQTIVHLLHDAPCVDEQSIKADKNSEAYRGATAMSAHRFSLNIERAQECAEFLAKGYFMNKKGFWQAADESNVKEMAKLQQQRQAMEQARQAYRSKRNGWHYEVKADSRGRMYYVSGMLNPQAGGVASYILSTAEQVTYDSTASFAQFISVLTADANLATACNLLNFTDKVKDFYGEVYALAANVACPAKDTFERECAKQYLMPKAYGSSDEASRERAIRMAEEAGNDASTAAGIVDALVGYQGLNKVKDAASDAAAALAAQGRQLAWTTPSGFKAKQDYWVMQSEEWNTTETGNTFMPTRITFKERTDTVKIKKESDSDKGSTATVAAAANFIQSLDAAFMAMVQCRYYEATGKTIIGVHDSFTLESATEVPTFKAIAWNTFCDIAESAELADMRRAIGLPQKEIFWLKRNKVPHFLDKE